MNSKTEKDKTKQIQDKCQTLLNEMLRDDDNKYCVDCDSKGPRWASWNLGVFLCIRCAGIHRNLGVHISKVKSVNLDTWTPEQVVSLQQMGNSRARAVYEANLPDNFRRPQSDSSLESFIRAKYEHKKYIAREWVPPVIPKVDWEKEIDEELERQKRKKKANTLTSVPIVGANGVDNKKQSIIKVEVPQIPKPKNASPKPSRVNNEKTTQDLLGLQNGEDGFTGFLSGPTANDDQTKSDEMKAAMEAAAKAEEESFFNQPIPSEKERTKLTKDSILALYSNVPPSQSQPVLYNIPTAQAGGFTPFQPPMQQQQQQFSIQNGMTPAQYQQYPTHNQYPMWQPSPSPYPPAMAPYGQTPQPQFTNAFQSSGFAGTTAAPPPVASNPFFGAQPTATGTTLQQQFATLTLGQTKSGTLWQ